MKSVNILPVAGKIFVYVEEDQRNVETFNTTLVEIDPFSHTKLGVTIVQVILITFDPMQVLVAITTLFTSIELKYNTKDLKMKDLCYQYTIDTYATKRSEKKDDLKKCESFVVWRQENTRRLELKSEYLTIERVYNTDSISISIKRVFMQVIFRNHRHRLFPTSLTRLTCVSNYDQIMFCVCIKIKIFLCMQTNHTHY